MKTMKTTAFLFAGLIALHSLAQASPPKDIDTRVDRLMNLGGAPGLALVVIEHGKATYVKGYGVKRLGSTDAVDPQTLFQIGSTTKAFTSASVAMLVEAGKLDWDESVSTYMPDFQMYDPWVTRHVTVRDLLTHHSGLGAGAGDLTFFPGGKFTRLETVQALRWLKPQYGFRTRFGYSNLNYVAAGLLIERVSGLTWEDFVRERILKPAGMTATLTDLRSRDLNSNRAQPHARIGPPARGFGKQAVLDEHEGLTENGGPAGMIMSSAEDMATWISIQLAHGQLPDGKGRLFSDASSQEMWGPVTPLPNPPAVGEMAAIRPNFKFYALGWIAQDYRGQRMISHSGATLGFMTLVVLLPDKGLGFVVMQNSEDGQVLQALQYELLDFYLDAPRTDWGKVFSARAKKARDDAAKVLSQKSAPPRRIARSADDAAYVGAYRDNWFGPMSVSVNAGRLFIEMGRNSGMTAELVHYSGDTFVAQWANTDIEPAYVIFEFANETQVRHVSLKAISPLADFSYDYNDLEFTPTPKLNQAK